MHSASALSGTCDVDRTRFAMFRHVPSRRIVNRLIVKEKLKYLQSSRVCARTKRQNGSDF